MARPRNFDEDEVLGCALAAFWRDGFEATTYKGLEVETGVGVRSLHNTFGEKEALFLRVLARYRELAQATLAQVFDPPGVAAIRALLSGMGQPAEGDEAIRNAGCLMVNTVFELGRASDAVRAEVEAYRQMWRDTFRTALEADGIPDAGRRAEFLVGALWGMLSQIRLEGRTEAAAPLAQVTIETVEAWAAGN